MAATKTPKYSRQRPKPVDRAFAELGGSRHYLGQYGTAESKQHFHQLLAEWTAGDGQLPLVPEQLTVVELIAPVEMKYSVAISMMVA